MRLSSMSSMEICAEKEVCPWHWAVPFGLSVSYVVAAILHNTWVAADFEALSRANGFVVLVGVAVTCALAMQRLSVVLIASEPPTLITTRTWFRKLKWSKQQTMQDAAWVRVKYLDDMRLAIEIGTHKDQTITVTRLPYSQGHIAIAESLCANVAQFLSLSNFE